MCVTNYTRYVAQLSGDLTHDYLALYLYDSVYSQSWGKTSYKIEKVDIVWIELYVANGFHEGGYDYSFKYNFDCNDLVHNWGPGILKNYIQTLTTYISNKEIRPLFMDTFNVNALKNLQDMELVVPDYVLINVDDTRKRYKVANLFKDYQFKYRIVSNKDLNDKILNDKKEFYYLQYVQTLNWKFFNIINSLTGEIIYSKCFDNSYAIKSKDFKLLGKKIKEIP